MTTAREQRKQSTSTKTSLKRAVSFCPNVKADAPYSKRPKCDGDLQAADKRRRYMRRGSKSPSMLRASFATMGPILQSCAASKECSSPRDQIMAYSPIANGIPYLDHDKHRLHQNAAQRRMSLMSALKLSLEKTAIVDNNGQPPFHGRKAERRLSTYQLLSQV